MSQAPAIAIALALPRLSHIAKAMAIAMALGQGLGQALAHVADHDTKDHTP